MTNATLTWGAAAGAVSYKVEYKLSSTGTWTVATAAVTATTFTVNGLQDGTSYDFRITTTCEVGTGGPTTTTQHTPCKDVSNASASITGTTATITWDKILPQGATYQVYYKLTSGSTFTDPASSLTWPGPPSGTGNPITNISGTGQVSCSIAGLTGGAAYDFQIKVICVDGELSNGVVVTASTSCPAPGAINVTFS